MKILFILLMASLTVTSAANAQDYPSRPIKLLVPYPAGGGTDVVARVVGQQLSDRLGQPVIIDNRSGASGRVGTELVVRSAADGYTLLFNNETVVVAPSITKNLPYDVRRDLTPIGTIGGSVVVIGINTKLAAKTLPELLTFIKATSGKLSYSSCGHGTVMHFAGEQLKLAAGLDLTHVPYRGCAPAIQDAASGQVPIFINVLPNARDLEHAGHLRILAVATRERSKLTPNTPTVSEQGFPGFEANTFYALYGPPNLPANITSRLSAALQEILTAPDFLQRMQHMLVETTPSSPKELEMLLQKDIERWNRVARDAGIEPE